MTDMMMDYTKTEYQNIFRKFFDADYLDVTYKYIFLHAMIDIGWFGRDGLVGKEWISENSGVVTLDLNFLAARFAKAYYDILNLGIKHTPTAKNQHDILAIIKGSRARGPLTLVDFASSKMKKLRRKIIQNSIKLEVSNLKQDFSLMFEESTRIDSIVFKISLVDFMRSHRNYLRHELGKKLSSYLKEQNKDRKILGCVSPTSPFYQYLLGQQRLFLVGVEREDSVRRFKMSVETKVDLKHWDGVNALTSVWGLRSTSDNKAMWMKIRQGDIVLFSKDGRCFAKGIVLKTIHSTSEARYLWGDEGDSGHDLLIVLDCVVDMHLDLVNSRIQLTQPTMPDEYNFPLIQVDDGLVSELISAYYDIETALESISERIKNGTHNVSFSLIEGKTRIRKGQSVFRTEVLRNYNETCAVCDICQEDLLEASHILPVGNLEFAGDIENGICLCVLHHKMFDKRYMYFNTDYAVKFTSKAPLYLRNTCTRLKITKSTCSKRPSRDYLRKSSDLIKYQE